MHLLFYNQIYSIVVTVGQQGTLDEMYRAANQIGDAFSEFVGSSKLPGEDINSLLFILFTISIFFLSNLSPNFYFSYEKPWHINYNKYSLISVFVLAGDNPGQKLQVES